MYWYYEKDNDQMGPVITHKLINMRKDGDIKTDTLVWKKGMKIWKPFKQILELAKEDPELSSQCIHCGDRFLKSKMLEISPSIFLAKTHQKVWEKEILKQCEDQDLTSVISLYTPASMQKRIFARIFDLSLTILITRISAKILQINNLEYFLCLLIFIGFIYRTLIVASKQNTLGKRLFGLKIISANGEKINLSKAALRSVTEIFSMTSIFIGYIISFYDKHKQSLHDSISSTYVVEDNK